MKIADALDIAIATIRRQKEWVVRERRSGTDTASFITAYRGSRQVALVAHAANRDVMLSLADTAAVGFGADVLALVAETWYSTLADNPRTGQPWVPGELAEVAQRHHGRERGWVTDALIVHVGNRAGDVALVLLPYEVTYRRVTWQEPVDYGDEVQIGGLVPDTLARSMMQRPSLDAMTHRLGVKPPAGMSPARARAHMDCATAKHIRSVHPRATVLLYADPDDTERAAAIRASLGAAAVRLDEEDGDQ